jgi:PhnB protein
MSIKPQERLGGVPGLSPYIQVPDANAASEFYQKAFGAVEMDRRLAKYGKRLIHCGVAINDGLVMFNDPFPEFGYGLEAPQGYTLHLQVSGIDRWWKRAVDAGCEVLSPLEDMFWGDRYGQLKDPFGVRWSLGEGKGGQA